MLHHDLKKKTYWQAEAIKHNTSCQMNVTRILDAAGISNVKKAPPVKINCHLFYHYDDNYLNRIQTFEQLTCQSL